MTALALVATLLLAVDPAAPPAPATPPAPAAAPTPKPYRPYAQRPGEAGHRGTPPPHGLGGRHGNPANLQAYAAGLVDPARDAWQQPDEVVKALALQPGQVVCDVGAGPGYFTLRLAAAVGPAGRVFAVDVEPALLGALLQRMGLGGVRNVTPVLSLPADPLLPAGACDLVLVVNTYHHFPDGPAYLARLAGALRPGGRVANVDFQKRETGGVGPPVDHRVAREAFLADAKAAGLAVVAEPTFLPHQYFLVLAPSAPAK